MNIIIRKAEAADCPRIMELVRELAEFEKAPQEVTVSLEHFTQSGFGSQPVWWGLVACNDEDEIIGFALYYIRYSTWKGQSMYLEDILVTQEHRGKGIGGLLMDRLIEEARSRGLQRICWQVLDWNAPAIAFYKKYGAAFDGEWINCAINV